METLSLAREAATAFYAAEQISDYPLLEEAVERFWHRHGEVS